MTTYPVKNHRLADSASLGDFWPFSSASGRSYTSGHVDNSSLHPRCGLALQEPSCDEPPVRESLADRRINKTVQPSRRMVFNIAFVEAKSELIDIAEQMLFAGVLAPFFSSDKGFIDFDGSPKLLQSAIWPVAAAGFTEPTQHEPCGLLSDADFFSELHGRNSLTCRDEQVHAVQPFMEGNLRAFHHRSSPNGEV